MASRDGGEAVVLRRGVHCTGGRRDNGVGGEGDQTKTAGSGAAGSGRFERKHSGAGGSEGGGNRDGLGDGGTGGHGAAFHAAPEWMVSGPADLGDEETGPGGAVPDRLHHGDGQTSVPECRGPGPLA